MSLLDIHVSPPTHPWRNEAPLEILEAGTGHGGLTIYLARAIQAANDPLVERRLRTFMRLHKGPSDGSISTTSEAGSTASSIGAHIAPIEKAEATLIKNWKDRRNAIVHTVDTSSRYSEHAQRVIRNFRHGVYHPQIEFYVGHVSAWITNQLAYRARRQSRSLVGEQPSSPPPDQASSSTPFLAYALLDLPSSHEQLENVARALKLDGKLIVFAPNVTQIVKCTETIRKSQLPLTPVTMLEIGPSAGTGGREWDIRSVKPREVLEAEAATKSLLTRRDNQSRGSRGAPTGFGAWVAATKDKGENGERGQNGEHDSVAGIEDMRMEIYLDEEKGREMICRPMPSSKVVWSAFIGVWSKK